MTTAAATRSRAQVSTPHRIRPGYVIADPAEPTAGSAPRTLNLRVPVDDLAKYAGITALASAVLAVAGILATVAYLSAWNVPAPVVRLDPTTAALRSDTVLYQFATLWALLLGLTALWHRLHTRRQLRSTVVGAAVGLLTTLAVMLAWSEAIGPAITVGGAVVLFVAMQRRWLGQRGLAIAFTLIALSSAYETGIENGVIIRDHSEWQTPVTLSVRLPVAGLDGGLAEGGGFAYDDLYLVFRDGESIYVSRPGGGTSVWIIPAGNLMSMGIPAR